MNSHPRDRRAPGSLEALALVAVTVLVAHFTRLAQFGLYEDDYWSIAPSLGGLISRLGSMAHFHFTHWPTGRPLNHLLPPVLGTLGSALGGLTGIYVLAAAWLSLNGLLVYLVARRLISAPGAVIAGALYVLFPADSTRILLTHAAHVQGAMTFLLLGSWLWLRGGPWRVASYPVAALCLLSYESTFLPFLFLPLFVPVERSRLLRTWATHLGAIALLVGLDAWARVATGDVRALAAAGDPGESLRRMVTSLWIGPLTSIASLARSAKVGVRSLDPLAILAALVFVLVLALVLSRSGDDADAVGEGTTDARPEGRRPPPWRLFLAAMLAWSGAYALTLTNYPPAQVTGRLTSTHVAAAWPAALVVGLLFDVLRGTGRWRGRLVAAIAAAWLAALVGYAHVLQRGYVLAWEEQRRFWSEITLKTPDVVAGWSVVVVGPPKDINRIILSNSWSDYLVHKQIHAPGYGEEIAAFSHLGYLGSLVAFERDGESWRWRPEFWVGTWLPIDRTRLALFEDDHGSLRRVEAVETPAGTLRTAAPIPAGPRTSWPDTPVSRLLFPEAFPLR